MKPIASVPSAVEVEIIRLEALPLADLRTFWMSRWGYAPRFRSPDFLRRLIAWRLQAECFGGLDAATKATLRRSGSLKPTPLPGTRLTREYRGVLHHVEVGEGTFLYNQTRYESLSAVARAITGVRWNGPRFFGLREKAYRR